MILEKNLKNINEDKVEKEEVTTTNVERDRLIVVGVLVLFLYIFETTWEQGASMNIFEVIIQIVLLEGSGVTIFKILSVLISFFQ